MKSAVICLFLKKSSLHYMCPGDKCSWSHHPALTGVCPTEGEQDCLITAYAGFAPEQQSAARESSRCPETSLTIFSKPLTNFSRSSRTSADFFYNCQLTCTSRRKQQITPFAHTCSAFLLSSLWILGGYYSHWHFCQSPVSPGALSAPSESFPLTFSRSLILGPEYAGEQDGQSDNLGLRCRIGREATPPSRQWQTAFLRKKQVGREGYSSIPRSLPCTSDCAGTSATHRWLICIFPRRDCFFLNGPLILPSGWGGGWGKEKKKSKKK